MTKKLTIVLATIFLVSCRGALICKEIKSTVIKPLVNCDISLEFKRCRCRCFNLNNFTKLDDKLCGEDFESGNYPIETCNNVAGFILDDWTTEIKPKIKKLDRIKRDNCK